ncbi:MAG: gliding-motility protein MglA [Deltaproteobacteria bacterium]|nr:gliding-motility protein MglA [Deltaproteobacteria bacterium]
MSFINPHTKEINCKIVYYGPRLAGKSTNLRQILKKVSSDGRGEIPSLKEEGDESLHFDFLPLILGSIKGYKVRFHLYTLPDQPHLEASRKIILKGVDGVIFVADSRVDQLDRNIESWRNLVAHLAEFDLDIKMLPAVVQLNKRDLKAVIPVSEFKQLFQGIELTEGIAKEGTGVMETLQVVARKVLKGLKKE